MKKPTASCPHAQREIDWKTRYSKEDFRDCQGKYWKCGRELLRRNQEAEWGSALSAARQRRRQSWRKPIGTVPR
jgi:hypothetical protein